MFAIRPNTHWTGQRSVAHSYTLFHHCTLGDTDSLPRGTIQFTAKTEEVLYRIWNKGND